MSSYFEALNRFRGRMQSFAKRYRLPLYTLAVIAFIIGLYISFKHLKVELKDLTYAPLIVILLITQPVLIFLNSLELKLCALASDSKMSLKDSIYVSSSATVANILPLPAGLILRGAALVKGGGNIAVVSKVLLIAALMWIAVAATVSGVVLASGVLAGVIILLGLIAILLLLFYTSRLSDMKTGFGFFIIRVLMVCVLTLQLKLCFAVMGQSVNLQDAAVYVVSSVAGAVVSIVPAGLGLTESFGALLAKLNGASSSLAYLGLSLNRLIGLGLAAIVVLILGRLKHQSHEFESQ